MAVVSFNNEDIWLVARWAFERLFRDIQEKYTINAEIQYIFEQAIALDGIHFEVIEPAEFRNEILNMMKYTIMELINDYSESLRKDLDPKGYVMYRGALPELLKYIEKYEVSTCR